MARWHGGYVATGNAVVTGETSATPVWVSTDGGSWSRLGPDRLGPATIVLGIGETAQGLVAVTLQGGEDACPYERAACPMLSAPLQAWTSQDGLAWTAHPGPRLELVEGCEGCGIDPPVVVFGPAGLLVMAGYVEGAISRDGVSWELLPNDTLPSSLNAGGVVGLGSGFAGVASRPVTIDGTRTRKPIAITSSDARSWTMHRIPVRDFNAHAGAGANRLVAGPGGLIAMGATGGAPGFALWWSSTDGREWTELAGYPPLGAWVGEGQGNGSTPNGTLIGNGDRMLAYRGNAPQAAWTSFDGVSWVPLTIEGGPSRWETSQNPDLVLTPVGVLGLGRDGAVWFGEPRIA